MKNINYPENIKKQGWNQMNDLLNKEMPERLSKRRVLLFFLILAFISTIGFFKISSNHRPEQSINIAQIGISQNEKVTLGELKETKKTVKHEESASVLRAKLQNRKDNKGKNQNRKNHILDELKNSVTNIKLYETHSEEMLYESQAAINISVDSRSQVEDIRRLFTLKTPFITENDKLVLKKMSVIKQAQYFKWYLNPYSEIRAFNNTTENFAPKFELSVGNTFYFDRRFYFDIAIGYTNSQLLVSSVKLAEDNFGAGLNISEIEFYDNRGINQKSLKNGVFEISMYEGYRFTRKFALKAGGGISFTKGINTVLTENTNKFINSDNGIEISTDNNGTIYLSDSYIIPDHTFFTDLNAQYTLRQKYSLEIGYKYYFNNYNVLTDTQNKSIYRAYVKQPPLISNFYLGLKYNFRK